MGKGGSQQREAGECTGQWTSIGKCAGGWGVRGGEGSKQESSRGAAAMTAKGTEPQSVVRGGLWGSGELGFEFET